MSEHRDELLALGAIGALTPEEVTDLEALLATDPAAAAEYAALLEDVTVLADSVAEQPPAALRDAVLGAVAAAANASPEDVTPAQGVVAPAAPTPLPPPAPTAREATVTPIHRRRWWIPATAAAAAVIVVGGALVVTRDADAPTDADVMEEILAAEDSVAVDLSGSVGALRLVKSEDEGATMLVGDGITAPPAEQVLQLWAIAEGQPASMGTFVPDDDGHVAVVMEGTEPTGVQYAVTIEPEGGSEQPTGDIVAGPSA